MAALQWELSSVDAAYVAAYAKMLSFVDFRYLLGSALLLSESSQHRENSDSINHWASMKNSFVKHNTINNAAASDATLIDADPATEALTKKMKRLHMTKASGLLLPSPLLSSTFSLPFSKGALKTTMERFYNSTVLMAQGLTDQTLRDMHLTLLNEGRKFGSMVASIQPHRSHGSRLSNLQQCFGSSLVSLHW